MPGLVTPPDAAPLRIVVPEDAEPQIRCGPEESKMTRSPAPKKTPSPSSSTSRAKPSPYSAGGGGKRKVSPGSGGGRTDEAALDNPDLGPFLLKVARDTMASGEGAGKALEYAIRASLSFERCIEAAAATGEEGPVMKLAMSLHVTAAIYCSLGRYEEAVGVLERALALVKEPGRGADHALAAFSGHMQLGDTYSMLGRLDRSIACYTKGLDIQAQTLGPSDPRVAETCR